MENAKQVLREIFDEVVEVFTDGWQDYLSCWGLMIGFFIVSSLVGYVFFCWVNGLPLI